MSGINASIYFITFSVVFCGMCYFITFSVVCASLLLCATLFILKLFVIWISLGFKQSYTNFFSICGQSFAKITSHIHAPLISRGEVLGVFFSFTFESSLGHLTCFGQWDISKHEINKDFKSTCALELSLSHAHLGPEDYNVKDPELEY